MLNSIRSPVHKIPSKYCYNNNNKCSYIKWLFKQILTI